MCVCVCVCTYICVCMCVYIYIYAYICTYILYKYICRYMYICLKYPSCYTIHMFEKAAKENVTLKECIFSVWNTIV